MPKVTIDNQVVEVPNGTLVVEAAKKAGVEIPVFCYHPKLQPVGMCRMCLVEIGTPKRGKDGNLEMDANGKPVIGWMPKLQTACTTVVSEGMAVCTTSKQVEDARRAVVEFLLTSVATQMQGRTLCPLGDFATSPALGTVKAFRAEYERHIKEHGCWAKHSNQ